MIVSVRYHYLLNIYTLVPLWVSTNDMIVLKDKMLRQINELVDYSCVLAELKHKYCLDNGRNALPPIRMFTNARSNGHIFGTPLKSVL